MREGKGGKDANEGNKRTKRKGKEGRKERCDAVRKRGEEEGITGEITRRNRSRSRGGEVIFSEPFLGVL